MVTGQRTFARRTAAETMAAILNEDPAEIVVDAPPGLRRSIARCLEKDPDARFQSARDLAFHLRALLDPVTQAGVPRSQRAGQRDGGVRCGSRGGAAAVTLSSCWACPGGPRGGCPIGRAVFLLPPDGIVVIPASGLGSGGSDCRLT